MRSNPRGYPFRMFPAVLLLTVWIWQNALPQTARSILVNACSKEKLDKVLLSRASWHPFPTASDRAGWNALPDALKSALVARGERYLNNKWPELPASLFLQYKRNGNRSNYERERGARRAALESLAVAECVEGKNRFIDDITNGIWAICEESYWGVPAHIGMQKAGSGLPDTAEPTVDLFAGETSSLLSWAVYLLKPQLETVSPLIVPRIEREIQTRILTPCLERDDFWWMGFQDREVNNWNPWINSNWLASALLVETDPAKRTAAVLKIAKSLDRFLDVYPSDGGCDEGPGYWGRAGASLFDCLELLRSATNGAVDVYAESLVREIAKYIYRAHIADGYFINYADASAKAGAPSDLTYRFGKRIEDPVLQVFGLSFRRDDGLPFPDGSLGRQLPAVFNYAELSSQPPAKPPLLRDVWFKNIEVMAARSKGGTEEGLFLSAKGAHNAESHNHNDVGNFLVFLGGKPMVIDVGVETYTAKTFSPMRYDIWTMQSAYHNCPTVNGIMQGAGRQYAAKQVTYAANDNRAETAMDIAGAYPPEANISAWKRTFRLNRGKGITVTDAYALSAPAKDITLTLMTPCNVAVVKPGELRMTERNAGNAPASLRVLYESETFKATIEDIAITDGRLKGVWGDALVRILLRADRPAMQADWTVRFAP